MSKTVIKLAYPIVINGRMTEQLEVRRPRVGDLLSVQNEKTQEAKELKLFANLCEVVPETLEQLDLVDYKALQEAYAGFLS
ncbi:MAG TPA: phage tail assembly protein [Thiotrichales bacterium]|nr:phage tail assembly protein [Thiotrichales bacterium]